jgi:hypothetical protein
MRKCEASARQRQPALAAVGAMVAGMTTTQAWVRGEEVGISGRCKLAEGLIGAMRVARRGQGKEGKE